MDDKEDWKRKLRTGLGEGIEQKYCAMLILFQSLFNLVGFFV